MADLKGSIVLDKDSEESLKEELRAQIVEEMIKDGSYQDEIKKYIDDCTVVAYFNMIERTINDVIKRTNEGDLRSNHFKMLEKLKIIEYVISL